MRIVAIVLLVIATALAVFGLWAAVEFGREYGIEAFWEVVGWFTLFTLVPLVLGMRLLRRSRSPEGYSERRKR